MMNVGTTNMKAAPAQPINQTNGDRTSIPAVGNINCESLSTLAHARDILVEVIGALCDEYPTFEPEDTNCVLAQAKAIQNMAEDIKLLSGRINSMIICR